MQRLVEWTEIIAGELLAAGDYGYTYRVLGLGAVWVAPAMVHEIVKLMARHHFVICTLVGLEAGSAEPDRWFLTSYAEQAELCHAG